MGRDAGPDVLLIAALHDSVLQYMAESSTLWQYLTVHGSVPQYMAVPVSIAVCPSTWQYLHLWQWARVHGSTYQALWKFEFRQCPKGEGVADKSMVSSGEKFLKGDQKYGGSDKAIQTLFDQRHFFNKGASLTPPW